MRTVTFSNPKVVELIRKHFVATWFNYEPGFHSCEGSQELSILETSPHGFGTKNWYTFFLLPDTTLLHMIPGYWSAALFEEQLKFVVDMVETLRDEQGKLRGNACELYSKIHRIRVGWAQQKERHITTEMPITQDRCDHSQAVDKSNPRFTTRDLKEAAERILPNHRHNGYCQVEFEKLFSILAQIHKTRADRGWEHLKDSHIAALPATTPFLDLTSTRGYKRSASLEQALKK